MRVTESSRACRHEAHALLTLAWPIVVTGISQVALQATDVLLVGHLLGAEELAPLVLATNLYSIPLLIGLGLIMGGSPLLAHELGRRFNSVRDTRRTVQQGFWVATLFGGIAIALLYRSDLIYRTLAQNPAAYDGAVAFLRMIMWGFIPCLCAINLRGFITALERPHAATVIAVCAISVNTAAGYILITGAFGLPRMGVAGVGAATALTNAAQFAALLGFILLDRRLRRYRIFAGLSKPDWVRMWELLRLGAPIAGTLLLEMSLFAAAAFAMGWLGTTELSAHQIAMQCSSIAFTVPLALGQAATVRVGLAMGRADAAAAARCGHIALIAAVAYAAVTATLLFTMPETIARQFVRSDGHAGTTDVVLLAARLLGAAAVFQVFDSCQAVALGILRGMKDTARPLLIALFCYLGPGLAGALVLAFPLRLGAIGIWAGLALGLAGTASLLVMRFAALVRSGAFAAERQSACQPANSAQRAACEKLGSPHGQTS